MPKALLLVLDDLMRSVANDFLDLLFTRGSHNWNVSVIFVTQSLQQRFENSRIIRNLSAKFSPDLSGGVRQLYVYAPKLVEDTIIGDRTASLLRVVNVFGMPEVDRARGLLCHFLALFDIFVHQCNHFDQLNQLHLLQ
ncbi:hypothetical protein GPALN_002228 [Globodera pallida]|nr:hypothetical protein GPALN_002228 [Globodera pallida]